MYVMRYCLASSHTQRFGSIAVFETLGLLPAFKRSSRTIMPSSEPNRCAQATGTPGIDGLLYRLCRKGIPRLHSAIPETIIFAVSNGPLVFRRNAERCGEFRRADRGQSPGAITSSHHINDAAHSSLIGGDTPRDETLSCVKVVAEAIRMIVQPPSSRTLRGDRRPGRRRLRLRILLCRRR